MWETLLKELSDNPTALAEAKKLQGNYNTLSSEVATLEGKLTEAITKRDKYKNFTKSVKGKLGFEEGEELSDEVLESKVSGLLTNAGQSATDKEKIAKLEIIKLEETINNLNNDLITAKNGNSKAVLDSKLELELYKTTQGVSAINPKANQMIIDELKSGATFEEGKIVFKGKDGTTVRKDGVALSLSQKLEDIKASEDYSFLFKADVNSGSGTQTGNTKGGNAGESDFAKQKRAQAAKLGIKL